MNSALLTPLMRMIERALIVLGGIIAIYLGYKLFELGIDKSQGEASAFKLVELKNFAPGLFFAALGAVILVTAMKAAIKFTPDPVFQPAKETNPEGIHDENRRILSKEPTPLFFGMEDLNRVSNKWSNISFFLETRELIDHLDQGKSPNEKKHLIEGLKTKLNIITMTPEEYNRHQELSEKIELDDKEEKELKSLENKLFPKKVDNPAGLS